MMFLLGRQAMLWHDPPMYLRSTRATRFPCCAVVHAATFDPVPLPRTTRSYSSGSVFFRDFCERTVSVSIDFLPFERGVSVSVGWLTSATQNAVQIESGADQGKMSKSLREIAKRFALWASLFRIESEMI